MGESGVGVVVAAVVLAAGVVGAEAVTRRWDLAETTGRKLMHIVSGLLVLVLVPLLAVRTFALLGAVFLVLMGGTRPLRLQALGALRDRSWGEVAFPAGIAAASVLAVDARALAGAVAVLTAADPAAWWVGRRVRSPQAPWGKSVAGSVAFLGVATVVLWWFVPLPTAALVAAAATVAEAVGVRGLDNLLIPTVTAAALRWCV